MVSLFLYFWAVIWSYTVDLFAALHEFASASARTLLKLASSVRALLKPYGDTLNEVWKTAFKSIHEQSSLTKQKANFFFLQDHEVNQLSSCGN